MGRAIKNLRRGGNSPKKPKGKATQVNKTGGGGIGKGPTGPGIDKTGAV